MDCAVWIQLHWALFSSVCWSCVTQWYILFINMFKLRAHFIWSINWLTHYRTISKLNLSNGVKLAKYFSLDLNKYEPKWSLRHINPVVTVETFPLHFPTNPTCCFIRTMSNFITSVFPTGFFFFRDWCVLGWKQVRWCTDYLMWTH